MNRRIRRSVGHEMKCEYYKWEHTVRWARKLVMKEYKMDFAKIEKDARKRAEDEEIKILFGDPTVPPPTGVMCVKVAEIIPTESWTTYPSLWEQK